MALYELSGTGVLGKKKTKKTKAQKKEKRKKVFKKVAKVTLGVARASFLSLVRLNLLGSAKRLSVAYQKDPLKVKAFWSKFGGNWEKLKKVIELGSKKKLSGLGTGDPVSSGIIATATPILLALLPLLKSLKAQGDSSEQKTLEDGVDTGIKTLEQDPNVDKSNVQTDQDFKTGKVQEGETESDTGNGMPSWLLPVAIGGGALFFLMRKK